MPSPRGGVREEEHASTQPSYASALKLEELRESLFSDEGRRGGGSWLRVRLVVGDQTQVEGACV